MAITNTPLMQLPLPGVGTESGPQYAVDVNNCLTIIDGHDHTPGSGTQITPNGLNISSDLAILNNNLTSIRSARFQAQPAVLSLPSDLGCLYEVGADLYYNDGVGNQIRITQSGGVAGTPGSIANLTPPASASYVAGNQTFVWQSNVNTPANLDAANVILRNLVASGSGLTLQAPTLSADYTITLPNLPSSTLPVVMSNAGTLSTQQITNAQTFNFGLVPVGALMPYYGASAPQGFLLCDGMAVSRSTYAALYAVIGDAAGNGDGSTTFNVPDVRGLFLRGVSGTSGNDPDTLTRTAQAPGGNTGNAVGSVQDDAFESHTHNMNRATGAGGTIGGAEPPHNGVGAGAGDGGILANGGDETRPKNVYCLYIIKT